MFILLLYLSRFCSKTPNKKGPSVGDSKKFCWYMPHHDIYLYPTFMSFCTRISFAFHQFIQFNLHSKGWGFSDVQVALPLHFFAPSFSMQSTKRQPKSWEFQQHWNTHIIAINILLKHIWRQMFCLASDNFSLADFYVGLCVNGIPFDGPWHAWVVFDPGGGALPLTAVCVR